MSAHLDRALPPIHSRLLILAVALLACLGLTALAPAPAGAACPPSEEPFGLCDLDVALSADPGGAPATQAGSHPYAFLTKLALNTREDPQSGKTVPVEEARDVVVSFPPGLLGDPSAVPRCSTLDFITGLRTECADTSAVGLARIEYGEPGTTSTPPLYNLVPSPGEVAKLGFVVEGRVPVVIDVRLNPDPPYNVIATSAGASQAVFFYGAEITTWGVPAAPAHDDERGLCAGAQTGCDVAIDEAPFLTLPTSCQGPLAFGFEADSWQQPGVWTDPLTVETHDDSIPPEPLDNGYCEKLGFGPTITAQPTARAASSPTGLDFSLDVSDPGLTSTSGIAASQIEKSVVTLPEGMSVNPSQAEGLEVCSEAQLAKETAFSAPGEGCPEAAKIGSLQLETPLLPEHLLRGSLYVAEPYENPFDSLLALYIVVKDPELGISVVQPAEVTPDPETGQLVTVAEDMPQLPFSHFRLHFKEGARSPLVTPPGCGAYEASAKFYPWSGTPPVTSSSTFQIVTGPGEGPCPKGGLPPFKPGLVAGTVNNAAGRFSPFNLRLSRSDSEQEITHFSIKLPPGIVGKLAGIPYCSDAAIQRAKERTGSHGGQEEIDDPSCPAASQIGRTLAGAGVGPALAYAPGKVYLAGPYHGSNLSMVAITSGVVGPFDIGTVVVREGFKIDPETAEVFIDSTGSDPIPHIIRGIPIHLRDIRAYVDRPEFVLNPTDCTATSTASTVLGSGLDFVSEADDNPITVTSPFQAADCAALPFEPKLGLRLIGGTKRGAHPAFKAHLQMNGIGEAGIAYSQVTLPRSEFIENAHFKTICTRVQFKAGAGNGAECPADSIYGKARAVTPILGEALEGPVFLRSSEHQLPDLVIALHNSQVDFDLVGHVDSVKGGGLRNTFEAAPDAPVSSFDLEMAGGKKGLFVNSTDLCAKTYRAKSLFVGQNGKVHRSKPKMKARCKGKKRKKQGKGGRDR